MAKLADYEELERMQPSKNGVDVFLDSLPELTEKDGKFAANFTYRQAGEVPRVQSFMIFDPFVGQEDVKKKLSDANKGKVLAIYGCMMAKESYDKFKELEFNNLKELHETALNGYFRETSLETPIKLMFGYSKGTGKNAGYPTLPTFGSFISTADRERTLVFDPNQISTKMVERRDASDKPNDGDDDDL